MKKILKNKIFVFIAFIVVLAFPIFTLCQTTQEKNNESLRNTVTHLKQHKISVESSNNVLLSGNYLFEEKGWQSPQVFLNKKEIAKTEFSWGQEKKVSTVSLT